MIRSPKIGMLVRLWYRKSITWLMPHHGRRGVVVAVGNGKGPRNAGVQLNDGTLVVVPRGNLQAIDDRQLDLFGKAAR